MRFLNSISCSSYSTRTQRRVGCVWLLQSSRIPHEDSCAFRAEPLLHVQLVTAQARGGQSMPRREPGFGEGATCHWLGQAGAVSYGSHSPSRAARVKFSGLAWPDHLFSCPTAILCWQTEELGENKISVFHGVALSITQTRVALGRPLPPGQEVKLMSV